MDVTFAFQTPRDGAPEEMDAKEFLEHCKNSGMRLRLTVLPFTTNDPAVGNGYSIIRAEFTDAERVHDKTD